jgi:haloacetate dehalogenase
VVLLHGHPRTHTTWHAVAPLLAARHTVVCPDLRGYGQSSKPATTPDHAPYAKRAMAADVVALMRALGHERFAVVGHDRGALVAFRTAMDHPGAVERLVAMDGLPVIEHVERCDARFARAWWHWFFFAQTEKPAERVISADPEAWYRPNRERMGEENLANYLRAIHDPATVHAMLEDYRAGLGIDVEHDAADRAAGRRIACPTLVLWSAQDDMEELYGDPIAIWSAWCDDVRAETIDAGHHVAEEAPEALAATLLRFLGAR